MIMRANARGSDRLSLIVACLLTALLLPSGSCAELQLGTRNEAFLKIAGDGFGGSFLAAGSSEFAETLAFKEHLAILLRSTGGLHHLELNDIDAYEVDPDGIMQSAWSKRFALSESANVNFLPDRVRIDFSIAFNHSRGISQKGLRDSLGEVSDARFWLNASRHAGNTTARRAASVCTESLYTAQCKTTCDGYLLTFCANCKCEESYGGTPQCTCYLQTLLVINALLAPTIYAVLMLLCGLCARSQIIKYVPLDNHWPNVGGQDFIDGQCSFMSNMNVCCMSCCCPAVRLAMSYWLAGFGNYTTLLIICCLLYAIPVVGGMIFIALIIIFYRRKIRWKAKMRMDTCTDVCCACFCGLCLICQEARHIDATWTEQRKQIAEEEAGKSESQLIGEAILVKAKDAKEKTKE